ncbi:MAG: hypothetical protein NVSMB26_08330 [Beijerinckiaceae bacterium]
MTNDILSGLEGLVALGKTGGLNMKPILLRVITDQFVSQPRHPAADIAQYSELAQQMIEEADGATVLGVAKRIAAHPDAPPAVIERLLSKGAEVAAAIFAAGAAVDTNRLAEHAEWGSLAEAVAIAGRNILDAQTAAALARRPETPVLCALAANPAAPLDAHAVSYLLQRGRSDRELGLVLLSRADFPGDRSALFLVANAAQRREMLLAAGRGDLGARADAKRKPQRDLGTLADLAAAQKWTLFTIELAVRLGCDPKGVQDIVRDPSGEPLAVALAALGMGPADAARIFLSSEPQISHRIDRIRTLTRITSDLPPRAARRLVFLMLGQSLPNEATRHRVYESATEVASLAARENTLRRAVPANPRPLVRFDRLTQHRS